MADFTKMVEMESEQLSDRMFGDACGLVDTLYGENAYIQHPDLVGSIFIGMSNNLQNLAWGIRLRTIEESIGSICISIETLKKGK